MLALIRKDSDKMLILPLVFYEMKLFVLSFCVVLPVFSYTGDMLLDSDKVFHIVDGDSINVRMRIAGIDTPEVNQKCKSTENETIDCGILSKKYFQKIIQEMPGDLVVSLVGVDHYNRLLVKVFKGSTDIGRLMVEDGMAFSYKDDYRLEEDASKKNKTGFWGFYSPPIEPYKWRKKYK